MKTTNVLLGAALIALSACNTPQNATDEPGSAMRNAHAGDPPPAVKVPAADRVAGRVADGATEEASVLNPRTSQRAMQDANGNGIDDGIDITDGNSDDLNGNGIPDEVEVDF